MADAKRFLRDVRDHQMLIEMDHGVHRSIRFGRPGSSAYHFRLVTWPGHLAISGDCSDYIFQRLPDMFEFFRCAGPAYDRDDYVNTSYWAEKLTSVCKHGDIHQLSEARFKAEIQRRFDDWTFDDDAEKARSLAYLTDNWDGLLGNPPHDLDTATRAACDYECPVTGQRFQDFWDAGIREYSFHLVWACRAIQWGIKRYDLHHQGRTQADHDRRVLARVT